jgi:hypothetical protein
MTKAHSIYFHDSRVIDHSLSTMNHEHDIFIFRFSSIIRHSPFALIFNTTYRKTITFSSHRCPCESTLAISSKFKITNNLIP